MAVRGNENLHNSFTAVAAVLSDSGYVVVV